MTDPITIVGGLVLLGLVLGPLLLGATAVWRSVDRRRRRPPVHLDPCRSKVSPLRGADDDILGWLQRADCGESRLFDTQEEACSAAGEHVSASRERACAPVTDPIGDDRWRERAVPAAEPGAAEPETPEPAAAAEPTGTPEPVEAPTTSTEPAAASEPAASTKPGTSSKPAASTKPEARAEARAEATTPVTSEDSVTTGSA